MSKLEILKRDLTVQKKKLEYLRAWESSFILTEAQATAVARLEKRIGNMERSEEAADNPDFKTMSCEEALKWQ